MLQRYDALVPSGVSVSAVRRVGQFVVMVGTLTLVKLTRSAASTDDDVVFDVRVNGVTIYADPADRATILDGERATTQELSTVVVDGDLVEVYLMEWPAGGLVGPCLVEVGVDDGVVLGTDVPLDKEMLVNAYYNAIIGRGPDGTELAAELASLDTACIAGSFDTQVLARMEALYDDPEHGAPTAADFVTGVYHAYFGRDPDATGGAFWVAQISAPINMPRDDMRSAFAGHPEFLNRVALYCRALLPVANAMKILGQNPLTYVQGILGTVISGEDLVVYDTGVLADGETENVSLNMGGSFIRVTRVEATFSLRVRAYYRNAQRTADAPRPVGSDPTGEHGCWLDFYLPPSNLDWDATPPCDGANYDNLASPNMWLAITNRSGASRSVRVILHRRFL